MALNLIDGQKAGSKSQRQPEIAPDSASSITKLKMTVGLSEGEIEGFGRADIKLDGTPLTSLSDDIICDYRFGTNDQEYINGVDEVANEIGVGVELTGSADWVKLISNPDIDHLGIRLRWGPLQTSHTNGDVSGVSITYEIHIAPVGGSYERVLATTLSDKTSDSYERYHEFKLPVSDNGWMVKVVRVTPSSQSSLISDKMYVQAYSEIIKSKFTYPYTSLVYLEYDAKMFSNVAKVAVNAKGLIIRVPSNYDPVTRQYSGLWSGTFKMAYSNNPAWVYYDLVTNPRYGCGDRIDQSMVDKWSLYRLAQYCDQMVDDGYGGLEPRFTCNVYLQSKERAYDILNRLTGLFRAINFWNGAQIVVDADIPQDTSYLYTNANVVDGLFEYAGTAATDLYSVAKVAWDNPANGYNTEYEAVSYEHLIKKYGFKVLELDAWGCTSRGQALRAGRWALLAESDTVTFKVGMDGYLAMPGKIIEIQDEFYAGKSNGGRVISISESRLEITLDRPVETIAGDTISFNTATGKVKKYNIVSSAGSVVTLSEAVDASVERMHIWAISSSQLATQKYRILTVKYDGVGEFTISAVEYNPRKYEEIDSNILFDEPPTSIINPIAQDAVKNVVIDSYEFVYQGLNTVNLNIKWERAVNAVEYLVEIKKDDGSWLKLPATGNNSIEVENIFAGSYIARVTAISAYELKSLPTYSVKTVIQGKLTAPQPPLNPRIVPILFGIEFYWDFPTSSADIAVSRIAISYEDPTHLDDETSFVTYDKAYSDNKLVLQHLDISTRVWLKVKLIDKLGFESPYTAWVSGEPSQDVDKVLDLVSGHISESTLDQILRGKIDGALGLAGEANSLANQANAAATNAQTIADQATVKAQEAANAAAQEAVDRAAALQDGITQVTTDYRAGDSVIYGELNAYKASNDTAMATVVQKAESAVAAGSTNSQAITELTGQVQTINNTKLDASVISNYYTKGQADDKSAEIAAGKIESYDANLVIGGANLLKNSEGVFTPNMSRADNYVIYQSSTVDMVNGKEYTLSGETNGEWSSVHSGNIESNKAVLWLVGNGLNIIISNSDVGTKGCTFVWEHPSGTYALRLNSYKADNSIWFKNIKIESGNKRTDWSPAPEDVASDINKVQANLSNFQEAQVNVDLAQTNRLNAAESQLGANAARITNVEQTYATRDGVAALARNALQSEWQTYANNSVNNLQIGGRNLLLNSNYSANPYKIYFAGGSYSQFGLSPVPDQSAAVLDTDTFITVSVWYTQLDSIDINKPFESLVIGRQDLNADPWTIRLWSRDASIKIVKEGNLYKLTGTVLIPKGGQLFADYPRLITIFGYGCYLHKIKIEKGSKATDYSPAPEDLIQDLNTFKSTVETVYSTKAEANSTTADIINRLNSKANQSGLDALSADVVNNYYTKAQTDSVTAGAVNRYKAELGNIINYTVVSRGNESGGVGYLQNAEGSWVVGGARSYTLVVFNGDGTVNWSRSHDIFGQGYPANQGLYNDINALPNGVYALIFTSDEPASNRNADLLFPALKMLGGTREVNDKLVYRGSYMLIGRKGMVEGTAVELVAPANQTITYALQFVNGVPVGIGNTPTAMPSQFASATAVQNIQADVSNINGQVSSQAYSITQLQSDVSSNSAKLIVQGEVVDGLKASYVIKIDVNGLVAGYGLYNTGSTSAFGVNADTFYIGSPSLDKKPFIQRNYWSQINGVWVPPGTYIDTAYIGAATIGTAHINDLAITTAKIDDGQITTAKIGDLQVDTLKIKDEAVTVPVGVSVDSTISLTNYNPGGNTDLAAQLASWETYIGTLASITINRKGGKCRIDAFVNITCPDPANSFSGAANGQVAGSSLMLAGARFFISVYRGTKLIGRASMAPTAVASTLYMAFNGTLTGVSFIDNDNITGNQTYTLKAGFGNVSSSPMGIYLTAQRFAYINERAMSVLELKK